MTRDEGCLRQRQGDATAGNGGKVGFVALLMAAMAAGTVGAPTLGVLSGYVLRDVGLSRTELGVVLGAVAFVGALASPFAGRVVDRIGPGRGMAAVFLLAAVGLLALALSRGMASALSFGVAAGVSQSLANPATNTAIVRRLLPGGRGVTTGLKQSGVQAGVFLIGVLVPLLADWAGWRATVLLMAGLLALAGVGTLLRRDRLGTDVLPTSQDQTMAPGDGALRRLLRPAWSGRSRATAMLSLYGALIGITAGFVSLLPLYAADAAGRSAQYGGFLVALAGVAAVGGRTLWATVAERSGRHHALLVVLAVGSGLGSLLVILGSDQAGMLWLAAGVLGLSASSWNAVGMVTIMRTTEGRNDTGAASGWVYFGFLLGVSVTGPVVGTARDYLGSYVPALSLMIVTSLAAAVAAALASRSILHEAGWRGAVGR